MLALAGCGGGAASSNAPDDSVLRIGFLGACATTTPAFPPEIDGHPLEVTRACPADVDHARKLVEGDGVDVVLAYPSDEGGFELALYAETQGDITFVDGTSSLPETTLEVQARNYYRFAPDGYQRAAGLGTYAYRRLGWRQADLRRASRVAANAFTVEFCALGGRVGGGRRVPRDLPVRTRVTAPDAVTELTHALVRARGDLKHLRDELGRGLDANRQVVVDVELLRGAEVVARLDNVEETFGGAFDEDDEPDYRAPCRDYEPPVWSR